ncbi:MAG: 2-C-methyl-D-erythritol 2,4-cyclodiphosphate synthase [Rikenellaceae bacterium]
MECKMRIGEGFDVHRLADGLPLILGGVRIDHTKGCVAHSDGDVLVHAICDALLGAAALGDIGKHFPDSDPRYRGIDSLVLLSEVVALLRQRGYRVVNIDSTIRAQRPKLRDVIDSMRERIAAAMGIDVDRVSIKATTTEELGFEGLQQGISASAIALIVG